jgi:hypothetical protein
LSQAGQERPVAQVPAHQGQNRPDRALKNVLTVKKGVFGDVLAGKRVDWHGKKAFYFALFHVLVVLRVFKSLSARIFRKMDASKKIAPKNLP